MRNLKKFLAVLVVAVMIVSSLAVTSFAAADPSMTPADKAVGLGLLQGGSNGVDEEYLNTNTQRIQTAIIYLRLLGLEDKAKAYTATTDNFADADKVKDVPGAVNLLAYLKANPQLGWVGDGTNFNPTGDVSGKALYKVMLTSLGYTQGLDFDYDDTIGFARAKGFALAAFVGTSDSVSNNAMAAAMMEAVDLPMNGKTTTLAQNLVDTKVITADVAAKYTGYTVAPVGPLAIKSIKSDNLIKFDVTFNAPLDATKGIDITNYTVKVGTDPAKTIRKDGITLSADKMTASIYLDANQQIKQSDKVTVTYKAAAAGTTADVTATSDAINDTTLPTVKSVAVVGNKLVQITMSEPLADSEIQNLGNFKIDGSVLPSAAPTVSTSGLVISLKLSSALAAGVHTVVVSGKDYATLPVVSNSNTITVATDTTAPAKVTLVGDATQAKVVCQFDKAIDGMDSAKVGTIPAAVAIDSTDASKVTLTFNATDGWLPYATSTITFTNVKDLYGNIAATLTLTVTPVLDNVRPTFVSMTQPSANLTAPAPAAPVQFVVTFSKEVAVPATSAFLLKDKDGNVNAVSGVAYYKPDGATDFNKAMLLLTTSSAIDDTSKGPWTLKITGVKDNTALSNEIVETTQTLTFADKTGPVPGDIVVARKDNTVYVSFGEKVDPATALSPSSYTLKNSTGGITSLPTDVSYSLSADGKVVTMVFGTSYDFATNAASMMVFGVKDAAGNLMQSSTGYLPVNAATSSTAPDFTAARLTDAHTIVLTMSGPSINTNTLAPYDFRVCYGATPTALTTNSATYAQNTTAPYAGDWEVTLKVNETLNTNATYTSGGVTTPIKVYTVDSPATTSLAGVALTAHKMSVVGSGQSVTDKCPAEVTAVNGVYTDAIGQNVAGKTTVVYIRLKTSERLDATLLDAAAGKADFTVSIDGVSRAFTTAVINNNEILFTVTGDNLYNKSYSINYVADSGYKVQDATGVAGTDTNRLKSFAAPFTGTVALP